MGCFAGMTIWVLIFTQTNMTRRFHNNRGLVTLTHSNWWGKRPE
jgi:hypothetical protein